LPVPNGWGRGDPQKNVFSPVEGKAEKGGLNRHPGILVHRGHSCRFWTKAFIFSKKVGGSLAQPGKGKKKKKGGPCSPFSQKETSFASAKVCPPSERSEENNHNNTKERTTKKKHFRVGGRRQISPHKRESRLKGKGGHSVCAPNPGGFALSNFLFGEKNKSVKSAGGPAQRLFGGDKKTSACCKPRP